MPLETCETINRTWGFNITDNRYKSVEELIGRLVRTAGTGANLLLNVGPMPDGRIQAECVERLAGMGDWLEKWGHTIYGTTAGPVRPAEWGAVTRKENVLYVHILDSSAESITLELPKVRSARWLNVDGRLDYTQDRRTGEVTFSLGGVGSPGGSDSLGGGLDTADSIIEVTL